MKLSIIIPVYNVEDYLKDCLDSVLAQNIQDFEIICVEDNSTDHSADILNDYAQNHSNIKVIYHDNNKGLSAARNTGIRYAQGEYIQFIDSDDMINPETCRRLYEYAKLCNADIVYFNMQFLNDDEKGLHRISQKKVAFPEVYSGRELFCLYQELSTPKPEAVRHFIRKDFLLDNNLFFYEGIIHEDMLFSFMAAMKAKKVADINEELYIYRQRNGSISWSQKEKTASSLMVCLINICSYWIANDFSTEENECISKFVQGMYKNYLYYKGYQTDIDILGNQKETLIQKIINTTYFGKVSFRKEDIEKLCNSKTNIIYGAGKVANDIIQCLKEEKINVSYVAVTDISNNPTVFNGVPIKAISDLSNYIDAMVIIGTSQQFHKEIISILRGYKFQNLIFPII